jgi:hypothetical protein
MQMLLCNDLIQGTSFACHAKARGFRLWRSINESTHNKADRLRLRAGTFVPVVSHFDEHLDQPLGKIKDYIPKRLH